MSKITIDRAVLEQALEFWNEGKGLALGELLQKALEQPQVEQEPVAHSIVAGALFDFMGWLTSRRERLVLSSTDDVAPAADAIKDFAKMRSLSISDAQVQKWHEHLSAPQPPRQPLDEETIYDLWDEKFRGWIGGEQFEIVVKAIERAHKIGA